MKKNTNNKLSNPIEKYFSKITRYHYYFFTILFTCKFFVFWHILNLIFLTPPMDYDCGDGGAKNMCPCDDPKWDNSVFVKTVQTKFQWICQKLWLVSFSESIAYVGTLIGALVFGLLSDRFGRLISFSSSCLLTAITGCLLTVISNGGLFMTIRCLEGIGVGGAIVTSYVFCVEYCGCRHRETITALFHIPLNFSHISIAGVSYLLRDYKQFQLAISIPVFLFVNVQWLTMESPKWLLDKGKIDEAALVMERFYKFNNNSREGIKEEMEAYHASTEKSQLRTKVWQIFRHRQLTINILCMSVIYFVCGMGYYGVSQYIGKMSGQIHLNVALSGAMLLPGSIASVFLLKILSRRPFLMATNLLSGIFMAIVIIIPSDYHWYRVIAACICNSFFWLSFIIVFLFSVEIFPTSVRNSVLGMLSVLSRLGQIIAPILNSLNDTYSGIIYSVMAIVGGLLCYPLPETKNVELPSSLEESKSLRRPRRSSRTAEPNSNIEIN